MRQPRTVHEKRGARRDNIESVYAVLEFSFGVYPPLSTVTCCCCSVCECYYLLILLVVIGVTGRKHRQRFVPSRLIDINSVVVAGRYSVLGTESSRAILIPRLVC